MRASRTCFLLALATAGAGCGSSGSNPAGSSDASSDGEQSLDDASMGGDAGDASNTDGTMGDGTSGYAGGAVEVRLASCEDGGTAGPNVTGTVAIVMVAATPAAISKIDVLVDGKSLGTVTSMPFDLPWSSSAVSNGPHTISATAYDLAGRTAAATPLQVTTNNFQLDGTWSWTGITDATSGFPTDTCSDTTFVVTFDAPTSTVTFPSFYVNCTAGNGATYQAQVTGFTAVVSPGLYGGPISDSQGTVTTNFSTTQLTQSNSFDGEVLSGALSRLAPGSGSTTCAILGGHDAGAEAGPEAGSDASSSDASGTDASGMDASGTDGAGTDGAVCLPIGGPDAGDAGPVCTLGQASCGDSTSVDICADPNNCGGCGTSCSLPQRCCSGGCGAFATTLFSTSDYAWGVAVDATSVYWTDNVGGSSGAIRKMNRDGTGTIATIASGQNAPQPIVVDSAAAYWLGGSGGPMSVPTGGGTPRSLATSSPIPYPHNLAIDDSYVYWTGDNGGVTFDATVQRVSKCGGAPETVVTEAGTEGTADIVTDGTFAYYVVWAAGANSTYLHKVPVGGGTPTLLATGNTQQSGLVLAAGTLYWKDCVIGSPLSCVIEALPTTGGTPRTVATDNTDYQSQLAVDDEYVYWTDWDPVNPEGGYGPGTISRAPIAGGPAIILSQSENLPVGIAVDRQYVFWANYTLSGPGSLRRGCK